MKKAGVVVAAVVVIALLVGAFYYVNLKHKTPSVDSEGLTEVQKINTRDLEADYPATPREVVRLYNRIITAYYAEIYTEEELAQLCEQARQLFDPQLQDNNPPTVYLTAVEQEVAEYASQSKTIAQSDVCASNDVMYVTDGDDKLAYVTASYFIKEGSQYNRTYEMYVLRKGEDNRWGILVYYQIDQEQATHD